MSEALSASASTPKRAPVSQEASIGLPSVVKVVPSREYDAVTLSPTCRRRSHRSCRSGSGMRCGSSAQPLCSVARVRVGLPVLCLRWKAM